MIASAPRRFVKLSALLKQAPRRSFAGLVLDGFDVVGAIAAEKRGRTLAKAAYVALRAGEPVWAERLARRGYAINSDSAAALQLAAILASVGQCEEAAGLLSTIADKKKGAAYREIRGVLHAKAGEVKEAFAMFDTLPGSLDPHRPLKAMLATALEMMEQCRLPTAMSFVAKMAERYPFDLITRAVKLRCHLLAGDSDEARQLTHPPDFAVERASTFERRAFVEAVADTMDLPGWMSELFDFLKEKIEQDRTHWLLYNRACIAARAISRDPEYAALLAAIPNEARNTPEALALMCRWNVDEHRFDEVSPYLDRLFALSASLFLETQLYFISTARDWDEIQVAYKACVECGVPLFGPSLMSLIHTYYYKSSLERIRDGLGKLEPFAGLAWSNVHFWQTYLRCLIAVGNDRRAAECYFQLPAGMARGAALGPFKMFFDATAGRHDEARKGWTRHIRATHHLCVNAPSSYPRTVALKYAEKPGAVLVFTTMFNAIEFVDWFLAHYRALGVDHFFVTDNGSNDGTLERLREQPDVSLFSNHESFARSAFGILWVNHLMQRYGIGHWCFHVDSDEGFVFPDCRGTRTLRDLLSYCDAHAFGSVPAVELDVYPESLDAAPDADPFAASCYFDVDYDTVRTELPPYTMIQGGLRRRLTGLAVLMHKAPLVLMAPDVRYTECNHTTTHLPQADVSAALLHYKFIGDMRRRVKEAISRREHFGGAIFYRRLDSAVKSSGAEATLLSSYSRRYDGTDSLVRHGLIRSAAAWEGYRSRPAAASIDVNIVGASG